ncbi:hypothetical protein SynROS8604_02629 [Synechococcus sp. ROS8604]|nr:hypothetical protein SynROS8604_02629 [Synechococcus sp. ROS8604]
MGVVFIFTSASLNSQLSIRDRNIRTDGVERLTRIGQIGMKIAGLMSTKTQPLMPRCR